MPFKVFDVVFFIGRHDYVTHTPTFFDRLQSYRICVYYFLYEIRTRLWMSVSVMEVN